MPSTLIHTSFGDLIRKLLISLDSYNTTDLELADVNNPDRDTSGVRAGFCINLALHQCYDLVKDSKYLESYPSQSLSSQDGLDYIDLDNEAFLDDIESITDTVQNIRLTQKSWRWYRANFPDPAQSPGTPSYYIRRGNRVYLASRPNEARPYLIDFKKFTGDLKLKGELSLLPTRYDYWVIEEAKEFWRSMEEEGYQMKIPMVRQSAIDSIMAVYDRALQSASNCEGEGAERDPYSRDFLE